MLKRFRADIIYSDFDPLMDLVEEARRRIGGSIIINEGLPNEERSYFQVEDCGHDETTPIPCVVTERWETGNGQGI